MQKVDPEEVVKAYIYAKDNHQWDKLVALLSPDYTSSDPSVPEPVKGIQAISQYFPMLDQVDLKTEILTMMSKGDDVAAELAVTCTIKEDDRSFTVKMAKFYRVNSKGLLVDEREYSDTETKFKALGEDAASAFQAVGEQEAGEPKTPTKQLGEKGDETTLTDITPKSIFEARIPENLKSNAEKLTGVNAVCQFTITGDHGGSWYIDLTTTPPAVMAGVSDKAKCIMTCSDRDFVNLVTGKTNATMAVITGKLKLTGDMGVAGMLRTVIR